MSFFWYQRTGGEEVWHEALSEHRSKILAEVKPAFVTVLDASVVPETGWSREQYDEVKYSGPFYVDWDAADLPEAISGFHKFLAKLQELDVDLTSLRLYATGGRGFHLEIPEAVFRAKVPKQGTNHLPGIYREMAMEMLVDSMDMRVYTGRRGRMWRTCGVQRSNGKYKVPLSVDEALRMTPEDYDILCSTPRPEFNRTEPRLNLALAALFTKSQDKVAKGVKTRGKSQKDVALLASFGGDWPPTIKRIMAGESLMPGLGFNRIALQLAITANALGKSEDDLIQACEGLIKNHASDGRYNSPRKRRESLRDLYHYTHESDAYAYSRGGIKSLCTPETPTGDLDGVDEHLGVGHVPDSDEAEGSDDLPGDVNDEIASAANTLLEGMLISKDGVFKRTPDGYKMLSNVAFTKPRLMVEAEDGMLLGFECDVRADGVLAPKPALVNFKAFQSRAALSAFCAGRGGIFSGSDTQAGVLQLMLTRSAKKGKRVNYVVRKAGLDLIQNPETRSEVDLVTIWAADDQVITMRKEFEGRFRYEPKISTNSQFKTDVHLAKMIRSTPDTIHWMHALFKMNSPTVVAQMLGWFVSCVHKQHYNLRFNQFPLLHPNGPAGSGKTLSTTLLGKMYHNTSAPMIRACGQGTTNFALRDCFSASASIPLILDEYKPAELKADRQDFLLQHFRLLYNQGVGASGGMSRGGADASFRDITEYSFSTPTAYIGESQEMQTAVVQRSVPVSFNPEDSKAHTKYFDIVNECSHFMPQLGRAIVGAALNDNVEERYESLRKRITALRASFDRSVHDRQVFNLAVVLEGLHYLEGLLQHPDLGFGSEFTGDLQTLQQSIYDHRTELQVSVMSEAAKTFNTMALMSRTESDESEYAIREGHEFIVKEGHIEVLMRESFVKYFAWCKRKGFAPLYTSDDAFISAMGKFPAVVDKVCFGSPLKKTGQTRVFRFSLEKLMQEGVELFKSKSLD